MSPLLARARRLAATAAGATLVLTLLTVPALPAHAAAVVPGADYCVGQCADIVPPGENGNATLADILAHRLLGTRPAHSADQLDKYANLVYSYTGLPEDQVTRFFNDSALGVPAGEVERSYSPRSDVRIVRDKGTG